ncbi:MAG: hypothetical protein IJJ72_06540 [Bacteroidales bacterium]|nr:hypothetical protein [Bacteroidales bacterium]
MKKRKIILFILLALTGFIALAYLAMNHLYVYCEGDNHYVSLFNDAQSKQLQAAKNAAFIGAPLKNRSALCTIPTQQLEKVHSCRYYKVTRLTYSMSFLTPKAKEELDAIAVDFHNKVKQNGLPKCRLLVTSLLRTQEDIEELKESNSNAVTNSAHLYGTTFDISWSAYQTISQKPLGPDYIKLLSETLKEHRNKKKVYVKYETRQKCFHITVRESV